MDRCFYILIPRALNVTLFENGAFTVTKLRVVGKDHHGLLRWDINPLTTIFIRDFQKKDTQKIGKFHVKKEAKIRVLRPNAKESLRL